MNKQILITGATGLLGRAVVKELRDENPVLAGRTEPKSRALEWRLLDLKNLRGLPGAVKGIHTIHHLASATRGFDREVDVAGTRALVDAAKAAGVAHFVYISIVGIDKVPLDYYRFKLETEQIIIDSGIPYTILRATQFHEFVDMLTTRFLPLPVAFLPKSVLIQPVETAVVAKRMVEIGRGAPHNAIFEIGGPENMDWGTLAEKWLRATGRKKIVIGLPGRILGKGVRALIDGGLLTHVRAENSIRWDEYLERTYGSKRSTRKGG